MTPLYLHVFCYLIIPVIARRGGGGSYGRGGGASYPSSRGLSGNNIHSGTYSSHSYARTHAYPAATGLSGNNRRPSDHHYQSTSYVHKTETHHHYHYSPPQHISYGSQQLPVFHGSPPVYVYEYRNSGSRFDNLLTGLALYNLGRMSSNADHHRYPNYNNEYRGETGERCMLKISKTNGEYEETRIDCKLVSSFIWDAEQEHPAPTSVVTKTVITQTVNKDNTTALQSSTVVEALQVKGPSIKVSPGMSCFLIRISRYSSTMQRKVECALLQEYASRSLRYNGSTRNYPVITVLMSILTTCFDINIFDNVSTFIT